MPKSSNKSKFQLLKGFKDILPEHQPLWEKIRKEAFGISSAYGYEQIDLPLLEQSILYTKGTGKNTDIVEKELYSFEDLNGENVTIRPEFTPGIARAYIEHGFLSKPQPVKLFTMGPVLRHENPQSGRYRQFNQLNLETIGSDSPVVDAELIILTYQFLRNVGIKSVVHINSIGDKEDRSNYITKLKQFLSSGNHKKELCENCRTRLSKNPLRVLDCKNEKCNEMLEEAPQIVDFLNEDAKKHFMQVLEYLDGMEINYVLDVKLVRGLDYYNRTTFEFYAEGEDTTRSQGALGGGGRYDDLIEMYGGRPTPSAGVGIGLERIISRLRDLDLPVDQSNKVDVFVAQLGMEARKEAFRLYEKLMESGFRVGQSFSKDGLKAQLEKANQQGAKLSLIIGQKELIDKTIIIRDMNSGIQETANYDKVVSELNRRLELTDAKVETIKQPKKK